MTETIINLVLGHPVAAISAVAGYAVAILAPVPVLSRAILDLWASFGSKIKDTVSSILGKFKSSK